MTAPIDPNPCVSNVFRISVVPKGADIDQQGRVSNLVFIRYVLDAATAHSTAVGLDHDAYVRLGAFFVVRRHEIDYLAPAFGGEELTVTTWIESWSAASSVRRTVVARASDNRELLTATTLWAMIATDSGRPRRIPAEVLEHFRRTDVPPARSV